MTVLTDIRQHFLRFLRSFYWRLSFSFFLLLLLSNAIGLALLIFYWQRTTDYGIQYLYRDQAANLKRQLDPYLQSPVDAIKLLGKATELLGLNPAVDIYFLDEHGKILWGTRPALAGRSVALEPITQFLDANVETFNPIYGTNPLRLDNLRTEVFSVARADFGPVDGYLYVVLKGEGYTNNFGKLGLINFERFSAFYLIAATVCLASLASVIFYLLTRHLTRMIRTVEAFKHGEYSARVEIYRDDEIGALGSAFNAMAATIQSNLETISKSDSQRRDLVANVSHDIRGPLTSITGFLQILISNYKEDLKPEAQECLSVIYNNVDVLRRLSTSLFELSYLEAREAAPAIETFALDELSEEVLGRFRPRAQDRNVFLHFEAPSSVPKVDADPALIDRVLTNLVDNALRYTPSGGAITISLSLAEQDIELLVIDTGTGIAPEHLPHLFERFYRVEGDESKGGTGLGLSIVKRILEAHGKIVNVKSELGRGTVFSFKLPISSC